MHCNTLMAAATRTLLQSSALQLEHVRIHGNKAVSALEWRTVLCLLKVNFIYSYRFTEFSNFVS